MTKAMKGTADVINHCRQSLVFGGGFGRGIQRLDVGESSDVDMKALSKSMSDRERDWFERLVAEGTLQVRQPSRREAHRDHLRGHPEAVGAAVDNAVLMEGLSVEAGIAKVAAATGLPQDEIGKLYQSSGGAYTAAQNAKE